MAFDGITTCALVSELKSALVGQKINKISQPEKEEIMFQIKGNGQNYRLLMSANATLPFVYLTDFNKPSPLTAPSFLMLLRKHIGNGTIIDISQPGLERIIRFDIRHLDEMGDVAIKHLYVELMGKHSNIIFCDSEDNILDSIKRIPAHVSSVREVLPGRKYFIPAQEGKICPYDFNRDIYENTIMKKPMATNKAIYTTLTGISPVIANELCFSSGFDADAVTASIIDERYEKLYENIIALVEKLKSETFEPVIYFEDSNHKPVEFSPVPLSIYSDKVAESNSSISQVLESFYHQKNLYTNINQKSADLRKIVSNHLDRARKKLMLQEKQQADTEKKDKYKVYGELLHTYGYMVNPGDKNVTVDNYYTNEKITIPLDETLSANDNAKKYFDKYTKLKRTDEALSTYIEETKASIAHLESIDSALNLAENSADLAAIKDELITYGYIKKHAASKKQREEKSKPLHFIDDNGFDIYVGKNNTQNDWLTFKFATGNDWWFHSKVIHGAHVIVKCENKELPDSTFEYAAALAAYYSDGRNDTTVEIDYIQKKNIKKPAGSAPGFVVYYTNYSITAKPDLSHVKQV